MPETATEQRPNTVSITDAGPSRKKLTIEVPADVVSGKLRESLDTLSVEAQVPGFRRGRVPRGLLERKFGASVRDEARKQIVAEAYAKAVEDHKLRVVGDPFSERADKAEVAEGKPLVFEVEVEVMPEFSLPPLDGIEVRRPIIPITDEMVAGELGKLRINEGKLEERPDPEPGDYLTGRGIMKLEDGSEVYNIPGAVVQVPAADRKGRGMILGIMVEDFTSQLGLPKPGQTVTVHATGPENHEIEKVRGAKLTMTFQVERVDRIIPAATEDVLRAYGFENESQLRDVIRQRLEQRAAVEQQSAMRQQAAAHLLSATEMELPQRLTAQQAYRTLERQRMELMYRGVEPTTIEERLSELRAASARLAAEELKLFFILNKAAEDLKIRVEEAEVNGRIAQMAAERNARPEALRQELIQKNQVVFVVQQVREHKTMDAILSKARVTDVSLEEFNRLQGRAASRPAAGRSEPAAKAEPKTKAPSPAAEADEAKPKPRSKKKS